MTIPKLIIILTSILVFCSTTITQNYNAFNKSSFNGSLGESQRNGMIYVPLKTFYVGNLYLDLRHIYSSVDFQGIKLILEINNNQTNKIYRPQLQLDICVKHYQIQASNNLEITAYYSITGQTIDEIENKQYNFLETLTINIIEPNSLQQKKSFLFVLTNKDEVKLPYNILNKSQLDNFSGYFLTDIQNSSDMKSRLSSTTNSYSDYWSNRELLVLPYIPYLSNCKNSGDYLNFAQITHKSQECNLYGQNTIPIEQFQFGSVATADNCKIVRQCIYDEIPQNNLEYTYWNTLDKKGSTLFSITSNQYESFTLNMQFGEGDLVPCTIKQTQGTNSSDVFPMKVTMKLKYYQVTNTQKRMMNCQIFYSLYVQSHKDFKYTLEIQFQPLSHTIVLLNFGFKWYIYMIVFVIIGLISNLQFIIFWVYHLIITIKPKIQTSFILFSRLCKEIFKGFFPASLIIIFLTFMVEILMQGTFFGSFISQKYVTFWDYLVLDNYGYFASQQLQMYRSSRMGFSYIIISSYIMIELSKLLIGHQRPKQQYEEYEVLGRKFKPKEWNRGKLLFVTFIYIFSCITFIYYTKTQFFNDNIWYMIAMMQILQMIIQKIVFTIYDDALPALPFKITLGVLSYLSTMGAIDLYYFILGYLVDVGIATIQLIYLSWLQDFISDFIIEKSQELNKFYINLLHDEQQQNDKKNDKNDELNNHLQILINNDVSEVQILKEDLQEQYQNLWCDNYIQGQTQGQKQIKMSYLSYFRENNNKNIKVQKLQYNKSYLREQQVQLKQLQNNKFGLLLDGTIGMLQYMMQPVVVLILWITYDTSYILQSYGISKVNCILYFLSSVILAIFFQMNIIIMLHVVELYFNFDYKHLVNGLLDNFQKKKRFWIVDSTEKEEKDQKYEFELGAISKYSMSSQMYFVISLYVCCMYFFIIGFNTIVGAKKNVLQDNFLILIVGFWVAILLFCKFLIKKILYLFNIWGYSSLSENQSNNKNQQTNLYDNSEQIQQETAIYLRKEEWLTQTKRFTFKNINKQQILEQQKSQKQRKMILNSKLNTICKELQPDFSRDDFRLDYARKNKIFIKENIQKILPMITQFADDDVQWFYMNNQDQKKVKKMEYKNVDPLIIDFVANWVKRVDVNRAKRQKNGAERQKMLKKCNFCYNTWCLYYGYDGMCMQCNKKLIERNKNQFVWLLD